MGITCCYCGLLLPAEKFYASQITANTKRGKCRACSVKKSHEWNVANRARHNANAARSHQKESVKARDTAWRKANRPYLAALMKKWRQEHPEEWKAITRRGRIKNIEKILIRNREREILEKTAMPPWADRDKIRAVYAEAKRLTRETGIEHEVDHIIPLRGKTVCGFHIETNLQILPAIVNRRKHNAFT
jgi:hypothetical protein